MGLPYYRLPSYRQYLMERCENMEEVNHYLNKEIREGIEKIKNDTSKYCGIIKRDVTWDKCMERYCIDCMLSKGMIYDTKFRNWAVYTIRRYNRWVARVREVNVADD